LKNFPYLCDKFGIGITIGSIRIDILVLSFFNKHTPFMDSLQARKAIKQLILLHNQILLAGGTYAFSTQNRHYIIKRKLLLKLFRLPLTEENYGLIFAYPLSPAFDFSDVPSEAMCYYRAKSIVLLYHYGILDGDSTAKRTGESWSLDEQVEYSYQSLLGRSNENAGRATPAA
jgi:hypothetical protein